MDATEPLISVVIAVRNGADTLQRALDSVYAQTYPRVELVVMDGASTDGSAEILERNSSRIAYWESQPDRGIYHAWNKALGHARGDWIMFLGADDRLARPDALSETALALSGATGRFQVVYRMLDVMNPSGAVVRTLGRPWSMARRRFLKGMSIPHPATFYDRSYFVQNGSFDESFVIAGDYEMLLRDVLRSDPLFVPGRAIVEMTTGGVSDRPESLINRAKEDHRARSLHGLERRPEWLSPAVVRARLKVLVRRTLGAGAAEVLVSAYRSARRLDS